VVAESLAEKGVVLRTSAYNELMSIIYEVASGIIWFISSRSMSSHVRIWRIEAVVTVALTSLFLVEVFGSGPPHSGFK